MERVEMLIYIVVFVAVIFLIVKYWKTGKKG